MFVLLGYKDFYDDNLITCKKITVMHFYLHVVFYQTVKVILSCIHSLFSVQVFDY